MSFYQGEKLFQENTEFFEKEYDITENVIKENKNTEINEDKNKDNKNDEKIDTENDKNTINIENLACVCEETEFTEISENKINNKNNISLNELQKTGNNFSDIIKKFKESIEKIEKERKNNLKKSKIIHIDDMKEKNYTRNLGLDYIFENNIKMSPFQKQKKDIVWVRIALSELVVLPGKIWIYLNNPFVAFSEKKYKHLILGKYFENKKEKYILGVPGVYLSNYRLEAGIQGFKQFKCCEDKRPSDGDYGYWLLKINV